MAKPFNGTINEVHDFHTTALCSPTRSCLMTGRNHTTSGMAGITEITDGFPNTSLALPLCD
jgi:arylsulfatase A-like enzyme